MTLDYRWKLTPVAYVSLISFIHSFVNFGKISVTYERRWAVVRKGRVTYMWHLTRKDDNPHTPNFKTIVVSRYYFLPEDISYRKLSKVQDKLRFCNLYVAEVGQPPSFFWWEQSTDTLSGNSLLNFFRATAPAMIIKRNAEPFFMLAKETKAHNNRKRARNGYALWDEANSLILSPWLILLVK